MRGCVGTYSTKHRIGAARSRHHFQSLRIQRSDWQESVSPFPSRSAIRTLHLRLRLFLLWVWRVNPRCSIWRKCIHLRERQTTCFCPTLPFRTTNVNCRHRCGAHTHGAQKQHNLCRKRSQLQFFVSRSTPHFSLFTFHSSLFTPHSSRSTLHAPRRKALRTFSLGEPTSICSSR